MTDRPYRRNAGSVFSLKYHLVWSPKYRKRVLIGNVAHDLRTLLYQKAAELGVIVEALEVMPDHVHLLVSADPSDSPQNLANQFKGFTSRVLRQKYVHLRRRLPALWSRSYFVASVGGASEKTTKRYIQTQKTRK